MQPTAEQIDVITHQEGSLAVLAGAGTGKTATFVQKCLHLVQNNEHARFLAVSFTIKSTEQLQSRLSQVFLENGLQTHRHWIVTIHGLCARILQENPLDAMIVRAPLTQTILSETQAKQLWKKSRDTLFFQKPIKTGSQPNALEAQKAFDRLARNHSIDAIIHLLDELKRTSPFLSQHEKDKRARSPTHQDAWTLFEQVMTHYERLKYHQCALDFADLEHKAFLALQNASLQHYYHQHFTSILVDEFQDTNPLQAKIIELLCKPGLSNLCMVGDPAQSIYGFRDADENAFEKGCLKSNQRLTLSGNFRSTAEILHFVNTVCEPLFAQSPIPFLKLQPARPLSHLQPSPATLLFDDTASLAQFVITKRLAAKASESVTLLLRKLRGNEDLIRQLQSDLYQAGMVLIVHGSSLFWSDCRVVELVALLTWWANPSDSVSGLTVLRADWVCSPTDSLKNCDHWVWEHQKEPENWFALFLQLDVELARLLTSLPDIDKPGSLAAHEVLTALLNSPFLYAKLGWSLLSLIQTTYELSYLGNSLQQVIAFLQEAKDSQERRTVTPATHLQTGMHVGLMTMHAAKGLEFDHVVLCDLPPEPKRHESAGVIWSPELGIFVPQRDSLGEIHKDKTHELFTTHFHNKQLQEAKRLFYVALTRGKETLSLCSIGAPTTFPPTRSVYTLDFWKGWVQQAGFPFTPWKAQEKDQKPTKHMLEPSPCLPRFSPPFMKKQFRLARLRHSVSDLVLLQECPRQFAFKLVNPEVVFFAQIKQGLSNPDSKMAQPDFLTLDKANPQQKLGTAIHALLAQVHMLSSEEIDRQISQMAQISFPGQNEQQALPHLGKLKQWILQSLNKEQQPDSGQDFWILDPGQSFYTEYAFEFTESVLNAQTNALEQEIVVGAIDRLILHAPTKASLIDFKVSALPLSSQRLVEYDRALRLYQYALRKLRPTLTHIQCFLVNIHSDGVQIKLRSGSWHLTQMQSLLTKANEIFNLRTSIPNPGKRCSRCVYQTVCDAAPKETRASEPNRPSMFPEPPFMPAPPPFE